MVVVREQPAKRGILCAHRRPSTFARTTRLSPLVLGDTERAFLHSAITNDDALLTQRLLAVQKQAYAEHPYPCIRAFHFVSLFMSTNPIYPAVLAAGSARPDALFLDLGCCMGTDVRKLVADGYPATRVLGCDIRAEFIVHGHALFADAASCPIRFFTGDVLALAHPPPPPSPPPSPPLTIQDEGELGRLRGRVTHLYAGALFHLFDETTQRAIALRVGGLLRRAPGSVVFGRHQGLAVAGMIDDHLGRTRYGHSEESWAALWRGVFVELEGEAFAERVVVRAELTEGFEGKLVGARAQVRMLVWSVQIV